MRKANVNDIPLYTKGIEYARENDEQNECRASLRRNIACKEAIEKAAAENYVDNHFYSAAVIGAVSVEFSLERIAYVLACTLQFKDYDGRLSRENKEWAKSIYVAPNPDSWGGDHNCYFVIDQVHSGLLDLLVTYFRKESLDAAE